MMYTDLKRILIFSDWFLPGYRAGGPIRSLANLVKALPHQFFILTSNKDHHSEIPYEGIEPNRWLPFAEHIQVMYLSDDHISASIFRRLIDEIHPDRLYFNSLFSARFTIMPLKVVKRMKLESRCIVAPRGMLKPGALSVKAGKKKIFLTYARLTGLYNNIEWHATNPEEEEEIRTHFKQNSTIHCAPNLPSSTQARSRKPLKNPGSMKLVCIARISPEKGILEAIRFLRHARLRGEVECDFYGTQQNTAYLQQCRTEASSARNIHIHFKGEIEPEHIPAMLGHYHFFYMATWGENFGHAIAEALCHATPVLISDRTPWQNLDTSKAGWVLPLNQDAFGKQLHEMLNMTHEEYLQWSDGAFKTGMARALDPAVLEASARLFGS